MLTSEQIEDIRKRAEEYEQRLNIAKLSNQQNAQFRAVGGFPGPDWDISLSEKQYAEDVSRLLYEIAWLKELLDTRQKDLEFAQQQLRDRESDLEFEYNSRIGAEQQLDELKDRLSTCESELRYEQLQRNAAEAR